MPTAPGGQRGSKRIGHAGRQRCRGGQRACGWSGCHRTPHCRRTRAAGPWRFWGLRWTWHIRPRTRDLQKDIMEKTPGNIAVSRRQYRAPRQLCDAEPHHGACVRCDHNSGGRQHQRNHTSGLGSAQARQATLRMQDCPSMPTPSGLARMMRYGAHGRWMSMRMCWGMAPQGIPIDINA